MVSEMRVTLSEAFKREAIAFVNDMRNNTDNSVTRDIWLEDLIPTLTDHEKVRIYEAYSAGELSEGAAHVLLGDAIYAVDQEIEAIQQAIENSQNFIVDQSDTASTGEA